ncbi:MAG: DMT family transporter [Thermoplasmata archaeon]|nr:DMT family transporter [Thermoplasmata archaeon]
MAGLFATLVVIWGLNYLAVRWGLSVAPPLWLALIRAALGAATVGAWLATTGRFGQLDRRGIRDALLVGIPNTALFFGLWFAGAVAVPPGQVAVLVYTFPLWVVLVSALGLHYRLRGIEILCLLTGFAGVALVAQPWGTAGGVIAPWAIGMLLAGAIFWAIGTVLFKLRFHGPSVHEANFFQLVGGSAALAVAAIALEAAPTTASETLVGSSLWLGVLGTGLAYGIWYELLDRYRATTLSVYVFLVPLVALVASVLLLGETLNAVQLVGVALVLASIYGTGVVSARVQGPPIAPATAP